MILCKAGKLQAAIVADTAAHPLFSAAAAELQSYLARITGDRAQRTAGADRQIVLAMNGRPFHREMPSTPELKNDGFRIATRGERLYIISQNGRGILFGVYRFLEEYLGCGFYSATVEKVPRYTDITLPEIDRTFLSPYEYRENWWYEYEHDPTFAKKRGMNSCEMTDMSADSFEPIRYNGLCHTLFDYVSPEEYYDTHPEYFSLVDGVRLREKSQLCLTNPDVLAIFQRKLREKIAAHPEKTLVSISQMDRRNYCTCPTCQKVYEEEGALSGTLLRFVNACARSIRDEFPDVTIDTFAYQYTRSAPRLTKPEPNVCIRICTIEACRKHSLWDCEESTHFQGKYEQGILRDDLADWTKCCERLYIWDYSTNFRFYLAPFPNFGVLKKNNQFFLAHHAVGLFQQGNAQSVSAEFGELRGYLCARLMWEPDLDMEAARDEFLQAYYGAGWTYLRDYLVTLEQKAAENEGHFGIYTPPEEYLPADLASFADPLFDKAEALAETPEVLRRVQKSRLSVRYMKLRALAFDDPRRDRLLTEFKNDLIAFGITYAREGSLASDGRDNTPEGYVEAWRRTKPEDMAEFDKNRKPRANL